MKNMETDKFVKFTKTAVPLFFALLLTLLIASGCAMMNGDDAVVTTAPTYTISGTVISPVTKAPAAGVTCSLSLDGTAGISAAADVSKTATTDQKGAYTFTGVPSGKYKIKSAGNGLIAMTTRFSVNSNTEHTIMQPAASEWTKLAGDANPYDPSKTYLTVHTDAYPERSIGTEDAGITVDIKKNGAAGGTQLAAYEAKGHYASDGSVDWTAAQTYDNGMTLFKGIVSNQAHTVTAQKEGFNFESVTDASAAPGEITHLILKGTPVVDGFPVTIVNNSGYKTSEIYLAVTGQDSSGNYYYYDPQTKDMKIGTSDATGANWCFPFTSLESTVENQFAYNHPFKNMFGGRVWIFFNKKGVFGVNDNDAKKMVQPSHTGGYIDTIFDKVELTCNGTTVTSNTTIVDFLGIAFKLKSSGGSEKGFSVASNDEIANAFLARTDDWKNCVVKDGKGNIIRVICPRDMSTFSKHLDSAIANGWAHYTTNEINFSYSNWTYKGYVDTAEGSVNKGKLVFKVTGGVGDGKSDIGDTYVIDSIPTTKVVWDCDGYPLANSGKAAEKNLHACICAALNRGVFCSSSWGNSDNFYKSTDLNNGKYNNFSQVLHEKAIKNLVYGFPYDDHFGKDPTFTISYAEAKKGVTLTIPKMPAYIKP